MLENTPCSNLFWTFLPPTKFTAEKLASSQHTACPSRESRARLDTCPCPGIDPFVLCRSEVNCKPTGHMDLTRIETLHHADRDKTEAHILELVVSLQHLISQSRAANGERSPIKSPVRSPTQRGSSITLSPNKASSSSPVLTQQEQEMLRDVKYRKFVPGISKSQEFDTKARHMKQSRLIKSNSHSPSSGNRKEFLSIRSMLPVIDFEIDRTKALDVIDNLKVQWGVEIDRCQVLDTSIRSVILKIPYCSKYTSDLPSRLPCACSEGACGSRAPIWRHQERDGWSGIRASLCMIWGERKGKFYCKKQSVVFVSSLYKQCKFWWKKGHQRSQCHIVFPQSKQLASIATFVAWSCFFFYEVLLLSAGGA